MGVHVDEAGRDHQSAGVQFQFPRAVDFADGRDVTLLHRHIGKERGIARPVDHASPAKNQIEGFRRASNWNECHPEPREHEPARLHAASLTGCGPESDC